MQIGFTPSSLKVWIPFASVVAPVCNVLAPSVNWLFACNNCDVPLCKLDKPACIWEEPFSNTVVPCFNVFVPSYNCLLPVTNLVVWEASTSTPSFFICEIPWLTVWLPTTNPGFCTVPFPSIPVFTCAKEPFKMAKLLVGSSIAKLSNADKLCCNATLLVCKAWIFSTSVVGFSVLIVWLLAWMVACIVAFAVSTFVVTSFAAFCATVTPCSICLAPTLILWLPASNCPNFVLIVCSPLCIAVIPSLTCFAPLFNTPLLALKVAIPWFNFEYSVLALLAPFCTWLIAWLNSWDFW